MDKLQLAESAAEIDGHWPINETSRIALREGQPLRVDEERGNLFAFAIATGNEPVEIVVHPNHRNKGLGSALMRDLIARGETSFWAHGALPAARKLAEDFELIPTRTILLMSRNSGTHLPLPEQSIRTFRPGDEEQIVAVNAKAFASHPEQGEMTVQSMRLLMTEPWFDPNGLFIAEREGQIAGFHWTKKFDGVGEVYVIGVSPDLQGSGIGRDLLVAGLNHMSDCERIDLFVEESNSAAISIYEQYGFTERSRDINYDRPVNY